MGDFNIYKVDNDWDEAFKSFTPFVDLESLYSFIDSQFDLYKNQINPPKDCVFRAFRCTPLSKVKVVLLGQDPYPGHGVADGLAFSARLQNKAPASLININKELNLEYESNVPVILDLSYLAMQGVFLYNTSILSKDGQPLFFGNVDLFHKFSQCVIQKIDSSNKGVVFILLGGKAAYYERFINKEKNYVIKAPHPSPLSAYRGFFHSGVFKKANQLLEKENKKAIDWLGLNINY